ncbi:sensor histidine kinase [Bacillus sp. AK128]
MSKGLLYWSGIGLLLVLHMHAMFSSVQLLFFIASLMGLLLSFFLYKKIMISIGSLNHWINGVWFAIQFLLVLVSLYSEQFWIQFLLVLIFIGIETTRIIIGNQVSALKQLNNNYEEERTHLNETFRIVRSQRHDFLKHVSAIQFLLEREEQEDARKYLEQLVGTYEETNLAIKGERGIVAGILHKMYKRATQSGISMIYDVDLPLSTLPISDQKMVALLGNLLSNSIEAAAEWQEQRNSQATITLQFYKRSGLHLLICKNNSLPIPTNILDKLYGSFGLTTKKEGHEGLGTKQILDVVKENQGYLDFQYKDEEFAVKIKIPAIR